MYIERIEATGFGGLPALDTTLDRVARLDGRPRALAAVVDALLLAFAAWDTGALAALSARWGCRGTVVEGGAVLPEGAHWDAAPGLASVLGPDSEGLLTVGLTLALDPLQFRKLRTLAGRDPRLVDALAEGARLTVRVGARFSPALDAVGIDPLAFVVGGESFPIGGADRPIWMTPFLQGLVGRLWHGPLPAAKWGEKAASWRVEDQLALRRAAAALGGPLGGLGDVIVLPEGPAALEADAVVPVARMGAEAVAGVVGAVHLSGAEVVIVERPDPAWLDWLAAQALEDGSPLEQVILLGVPDGQVVG